MTTALLAWLIVSAIIVLLMFVAPRAAEMAIFGPIALAFLLLGVIAWPFVQLANFVERRR